MKQVFTHLKGLLLVFLFYGVVSQSTHAQAVSEIVTDYQGFWQSGVGAINPIKPMNSHNLVSFSFNGQRYSTGVNDALLASNGLEFSAQDFHALPMQYFTGTPVSGTYIGLGQLYDGVDNGPGNPAPVNNIPMYLMDGIKGLDIGTCVANIPTGLISFGINSIFEPNIGDGVPDILITQIAQPGGATDQYAFRDADGNVVGNTVNIVLDNITPVGNWVADFYSVVHNPMIITSGFTNTERQLRLWAADLADFGITAANFSQITSFTVSLRGSSDIAFIAYNYETVEVTPLPAGIAVQKDGVYRDANENCIVDAGDVIDYTFKVINTGQAILNNVTVADPMIEVIGSPISLAPGASNQNNFSGTYALTAQDILAGVVYNQATVTGMNPQNEAVTSTSVDPTPVSNNSPFFDPACPTCTVTVLPTPLSINVPGNAVLEGCGVSVLNPLTYSTTPVTLSPAQFNAAGGSIANPGMLTGISYVDTSEGTCSVVVTRTFTLTTACDTFTYTQTITINDTTAPVAQNPNPTVLEGCGTMFPAPDTSVVIGATDSCSEVSVAFTSESAAVLEGCSETITRIFTVSDACGNTTEVTHVLTRTMDLESPMVSNPADIVIVGVNQPLPDPDTSVVIGATDNCGAVTVAYVGDAAPEGTCQVTVVRTYSVTDACGNVTEVFQNIIRTIDTTAPEVQLQDLISPCGFTVTAPTATDDCSGVVTGTTTDPITFTEAGTYTINWTFTDAAGNAVTVPQIVKVNFDAAPQAPVLADVTAQCSTTVTAPEVYDPCADVTITGTTSDATTFDAFGTYTITWTFDYGAGVTTSALQNVNIVDSEAPVAQEIETITAECGVTVEAPFATDGCEGQIAGITTDATAFTSPGQYNITWSFTDAAGNTSVRTQTVIVTAIPLKLPLVDDLFASCSLTADPLHATHPCTGEVITATTTNPVTYDAQGSYTITWDFEYEGQTLSVNQNIVILDNVAPVVVVEDLSSACAITVEAPVATDNCDGAITGTTSDATSFTAEGTYTINWTFTDAAGNTTTAPQIVTIDPSTLPAPTPLETITAECSVTLTAPVQNDPCSEEAVTATTEDTLVYDAVGTYSVNWTFTFSTGTITLVQTVVVTDTEAPITTALSEVTAYCQTTLPVAMADDACEGPIEGSTETTYFDTPGTYEVVWTFTDSHGNISMATQMVTILESAAAQATATAECNNDISAMVDLGLLLPEGMPQGGVWTDVNQTGGLEQDIFIPYGVAVGTYAFQYQVNAEGCALTLNAVVTVGDDCAVLPCETLRVHNAITPNNDGDNDVMIIDGIDASCYSENSIEIFNRWGVLVYEARNYDNTNVVFRGQSEGRATLQKGEDLPSGTYFYVLRYASEDGTYGEKSSYLYISR